jgi:tripartite-type tricarboxylate transporter receptor subunit TctC
MLVSRRNVLRVSASAAALPVVSRTGWAQAYPSKLVRWVVQFPPGGPNDILARIMTPWLSERLGQQFIIENRPGAAGNVGTMAVVRSAPDGYTLVSTGSPHTINTTLNEKLNFDVRRDLAPVIGFIRTALVLIIDPSIPAKTVPEFIAYAKANPNRMSMASAGTGTAQHISGEMLKMMTGINANHIPFGGSAPALTNVIGGQVQFMFDTTPASMEFIKTDKVRALAVTSGKRLEMLPNVPSIAEYLPEFEASAWYGLAAPKNTPEQIVNLLNREISTALRDVRIRAKVDELGGELIAGTPADLAKHIADETEKWAKVIKFAGLKAE